MLNYLIELRRRGLFIAFVFSIFFLFFFFFANDLFLTLISPLRKSLPFPQKLIATQITSTVITPLKLAVNVAILCTAPFALLQIWGFISPALYRDERSPLRGAMIISLVLFFLGILFCFYIILPFMFQFFVSNLPTGVKLMPEISDSIDFITYMLLLFGFCFQVPLICLLVTRLRWISIQQLQKIRPYIIVLAFTLGMLLTPPDVLSQVMLAIPLWFLYEFGVLLSRLALMSYQKN